MYSEKITIRKGHFCPVSSQKWYCNGKKARRATNGPKKCNEFGMKADSGLEAREQNKSFTYMPTHTPR